MGNVIDMAKMKQQVMTLQLSLIGWEISICTLLRLQLQSSSGKLQVLLSYI